MTLSQIETQIKEMELQLLKLARQLCFNKISNNVTYIVSEINNETSINQLKTPKKEVNATLNFEQAIQKIKDLYPSIYDINLYIHKANKNQTIVDIRYFKRNANTADTKEPMLHCKVSHPPYRLESQKFDVNWEFHNLRYKWNMFKLKLGLNKNVR